MADNSPPTMCAPPGTRTCNAPFGWLSDGASRRSCSFITLTANLIYRDLRRPIGSRPADRLDQTV